MRQHDIGYPMTVDWLANRASSKVNPLKLHTGPYSIGYTTSDVTSIDALLRLPKSRGPVPQAIYQSVTLSPETLPATTTTTQMDTAPQFDDDFFETAFDGIIEAVPITIEAVRAEVTGTTPGKLKGYLEDCSPDRIAGWAQNAFPSAPPVQLCIMLGRIVLANISADSWRADLSDADIGTGHHAFDFQPIPPIARDLLGEVKVFRVEDRVELPRVFELINQ
jgi:hypothetical protein